MKCIQQKNSGAGFISEHGRFCACNGSMCEADATHHVHLGFWCANGCRRHAEALATKRKGELSEGIFINEVRAEG